MVYASFHRTWQYNELYIGWAIEFTKLPASGRTKTWMMKKLLNIDDGWLAGFPNCPPQGNPGGGVDVVVDLEAVARRWLGKAQGANKGRA